MSWLSDLVDAGGEIVDKAIDFNLADARIDAGIIGQAQAGETTAAAPLTPVERMRLAAPGDFAAWLPWIAAGGAALLLVVVLRR